MSHELTIEVECCSAFYLILRALALQVEDIISNLRIFGNTVEGMGTAHLMFHFGMKPESAAPTSNLMVFAVMPTTASKLMFA